MYTKISEILDMPKYLSAKDALEENLRESVFNKKLNTKYANCQIKIDVLRHIVSSFNSGVSKENLVSIDELIPADSLEDIRKYYGTLTGRLKNKLPGIIGVSYEKINGGRNKVNNYYLKKEFIKGFDEKFKIDGKETLLELLSILESECKSESS